MSNNFQNQSKSGGYKGSRGSCVIIIGLMNKFLLIVFCKSNKVLLNSGSHVNANDRWQFTPLHEAAQKGRTQLCSLLLAHGADPYVKNQEGQTPFQVSGQEDVRCLLRFEYKFSDFFKFFKF